MHLFDDGAFFLLRWFHFLAGITWIGILYYFNFVQTPFFKGADPAVRSGMIRGLVPVALWWFRWGAMFTFLTGWTIILMKTHGDGALPWSSSYVTLILTGGLMGTFMWANVWFIIWPAQKIVIASAEQVAGGGEAIPEAAARGAVAGMASRTNTLFSIPMLFFMGAASHLPGLGSSNGVTVYWILTALVILVVQGNAMAGNATTQAPLKSVKGVITAGFVLTAVLYLIAEITLSMG